LISSQGANSLLMSVAAHPSTTKSPQMLPPHHYIVSLRSWIETQNRACRCDHLHLIVSSCPKSPKLPLYHKYSLLKVNHITRSHWKPPKTDKNDGCDYNRSLNPKLFHLFPWFSHENANTRPPISFLTLLAKQKIKC
jgi:hypothetical protein